MASKKLLSDQLRQAIDSSGVTRYAFCKAIKLEQSAMSRFMKGEQGLSLEVIDRIGKLLNLTLSSGNLLVVDKGKVKPLPLDNVTSDRISKKGG
jgi:transcriptional regulator with XRE-family HTH domain